MKKQTSIFLVILLCMLVAVAAGGTSYLVLANAHDQETQSLNDQIDRLETQVAKLQKEAKSATTAKTTTTPTSTETATTTTPDPTANWKTYTNTKYHYSIKYPTNWTFRQYPDTATGAGFKPTASANNIDSETINIDYIVRPTDSTSLSFEDYVKTAYNEIENHLSLASKVAITSDSNIAGYETTHNIQLRNSPSQEISQPITYFPPKQNANLGTVEISLGNASDLTTYNQMIKTFAYTN